MGKKTITATKNVYELAQERLKVIFNEFDNINVVIERRVKHEYDKIGRIHDELEAIEIDKQIRQMLINKGIIYNTLPCEEESIKEVLSLYDHC